MEQKERSEIYYMPNTSGVAVVHLRWIIRKNRRSCERQDANDKMTFSLFCKYGTVIIGNNYTVQVKSHK